VKELLMPLSAYTPSRALLALMLAWTGGAVRAQAFDAAGLYAVPLEDGQRLPGLAVVRP
jgi:hypothetical protein